MYLRLFKAKYNTQIEVRRFNSYVVHCQFAYFHAVTHYEEG